MNFDERMDRLTERHEALAQTVELLTHQTRENAATIERILHAISQDAENIRALARIAEAHEHRLDHLEGDVQ